MVSNSCVKYKNVNVRVRRMCKSELGCRGILAFRGSPFLPHILIRRVPPESERGVSALLTPPGQGRVAQRLAPKNVIEI